jgi:hypothetical protein
VGWGVGLVGFRDLGLEAALVAMAIAVLATNYLSHAAAWLEALPARRSGRGGSGAEAGRAALLPGDKAEIAVT